MIYNQIVAWTAFAILAMFYSCACTHQGLEIDLTAESDAALLQQRRLVDKLPREELEDRWSFSIRLTYSERIHICTQGGHILLYKGEDVD